MAACLVCNMSRQSPWVRHSRAELGGTSLGSQGTQQTSGSPRHVYTSVTAMCGALTCKSKPRTLHLLHCSMNDTLIVRMLRCSRWLWGLHCLNHALRGWYGGMWQNCAGSG